ncbi:MAG: hypothetical protein FWF92_01095 [Oscillospiraceae bacterium]|nr:hypothetical protein [Oscillospiraceae bacterium]
MMNEFNKEDIKNIFGEIKTPEYNPTDDIKQKINHGYKIKPKISRLKRTVIIIAAIMGVIILMGAGLNMIVQRVFDADGNSHLQFIPFRHRFRHDPNDEKVLFEREFYDYPNAENILVIRRGDGTGWSDPRRNISDYDELQKYIDGDIFKLPEYVPDGYKFSNADIYFYIDEDFDFENAELIAHEEKFGNVYEKYYIPENPDNISQLFIYYVKEENGEEVYLFYNIFLMDPGFINTNISGQENTTGEILQMPQFDRNILLSTDSYEDGNYFTQYNFHGIKIIPLKYGYDILNQEYGTVFYIISTYSLSQNEIIKMAESIK